MGHGGSTRSKSAPLPSLVVGRLPKRERERVPCRLKTKPLKSQLILLQRCGTHTQLIPSHFLCWFLLFPSSIPQKISIYKNYCHEVFGIISNKLSISIICSFVRFHEHPRGSELALLKAGTVMSAGDNRQQNYLTDRKNINVSVWVVY